MMLPWLVRCWRFGWEDACDPHDPPPPPGPPTVEQCWADMEESNAEAQFRYSMAQHRTLDDHRNRLYDVAWTLVRHHDATPESIEHELRARHLDMVWLYGVRHDPDGPEVATVCRDPLTRETRPHSLGIFLGPESEALVVRQTAGNLPLSQCGFLETQ